MSELHDLCTSVREAVREAAARIQAISSESLDTRVKGDDSPVTRADREADAWLRSRLLELRPAGWLSEESADSPDRLRAETLWIVDPLDGTKEFVRGVPEYCVAVALVQAGRPVVGVVHNPATDDAFWAVRGEGAYRNGAPMAVREGSRLLASRSEVPRGELRPFEASWEIVPTGSIQLKLALVAAGVAAVTLSRGPKHEWDVCAGALLVEESGGVATALFGEPLRYNQTTPKVRGILAGAPEAHARAALEARAIGASERMKELDTNTTSKAANKGGRP